MPRTSEVDPKKALEDILNQEQILLTEIDIQVVLRLLVEKGIVTREEVVKTREDVKNSPKRKPLWDELQQEKQLYQMAIDNPQAYLQALLKAKMNGGK